jgi:hypothetical protein
MFHIEYMRDAWTGQRETFLNALPGNHSYAAVLPGTSSAHHMHMFQPPDLVNHETMDQVKEAGVVEKENVPNKKRQRPKALKSPKVKKDMRGPRAPKPEGSPSVQLVRSAKKTAEIMINGINIDISVIPIPVSLCMGTPQQCYHWVCGAWLSVCCMTCISMYPLPMSTKRHGSRIAGRKK